MHYFREATKIEEAGEKKKSECCGENKTKQDEKLALEEKVFRKFFHSFFKNEKNLIIF